MQGQHADARQHFLESLDLYRRLGDKKGIAGTVRFLGQLSYRNRNYPAAAEVLEECLTLERELGSALRAAEALGFLGAIAEAAGHSERAVELYEESLVRYTEADNRSGAREVVRRLADLRFRMRVG